MRIFKQSIYFVEGRTILVLGGGEIVFERGYMLTSIKLVHERFNVLESFIELSFIIEGELAQEVLVVGVLLLQESEILRLNLLKNFVLAHEIGEFVLFRVLCTHFKLLSYFNFLY